MAVFVREEEIEVPDHIKFLMNLFGVEKAMVPVYADMVYAANMTRRIDWERFIWACGPVHRTSFTTMRDGAIGIIYDGKDRDPEVILQHKRFHKARWLETHDALPPAEDIANAKAHLAHLRKPVLAMMSDAERDEYVSSKMYGTEDSDPGRIVFHADPDPKPQREQYPFGDHRACTPGLIPIHRGCSTDGWDMYNADVALWTHRQTDRGYAGPSGLLFIDEDTIPFSFESDVEAEAVGE